MMVATALACTSCLGDGDSDNIYYSYDDTAVTGFTLGTLNRYIHTLSSKTGNDTTLVSTVNGSNYPMTIDHEARRIYNRDSLPYGTDDAHVITSVQTKNNGLAVWRMLTDEELYVNATSTDSIDLSQDRTLRVYAINGSGLYRDYTVRLNVAKQASGTYNWQQMDQSSALAAAESVSLVSTGSALLALAANGTATDVYRWTGSQWQQLTPAGDFRLKANACRNTVAKDGMLYALSADSLLSSTDGTTWQFVSREPQLAQLVAAGTRELFAISTDGRMLHSTDNGTSWTADDMEATADAARMPVKGTAAVVMPYAPSDFTDYVLMAGESIADKQFCSLWRKISVYSNGNEQTADPEGQWVYMPFDSKNSNQLPCNDRLCMVVYDGKLLANGNGTALLQSRDQGLTWREVSAFSLPTTATGTIAAMTVAPDGTLMLLTTTGMLFALR